MQELNSMRNIWTNSSNEFDPSGVGGILGSVTPDFIRGYSNSCPSDTLWSFGHTAILRTHCGPSDTLRSFGHIAVLRTHCGPSGTLGSFGHTGVLPIHCG